MKRILVFFLAMLILMSFTGCAMLEQIVADVMSQTTTEQEVTTEPEVEATTEPEPTEKTLPSFEECRVLSYYLSESPYNNSLPRFTDIEPVEDRTIHLRLYDYIYYNGEAVRQLAPGDLLILGDREITVKSVVTESAASAGFYTEDFYIINAGQGQNCVRMFPMNRYDVQTGQMKLDYMATNSTGQYYCVLREELDTIVPPLLEFDDRGPNAVPVEEGYGKGRDAFLEDLKKNPQRYRIDNSEALVYVSGDKYGELESITVGFTEGLLHDNEQMVLRERLNPVDPNRLLFLMTGEES